jgi:tetratricopeptide (TPR) repeat protein
LLNTDAFGLIDDRAAPLNTLDYPALEFEISRLRTRNIQKFKARLREKMNPAEIARALEPAMPFRPENLLLHSDLLFGDSTITSRWRQLLEPAGTEFLRDYNAAKLEHWRRLIERTQSAAAHRGMGEELLSQGNSENAIAEFQKALELAPLDPNTYFGLGNAEETANNFEDALRDYARAFDQDPNRADLVFRMGRLCHKMSRDSEALVFLDAARSRADDGETEVYRGRVLEKLGLRSEAAAAYRKAVSFQPDRSDVRELLAHLEAAQP